MVSVRDGVVAFTLGYREPTDVGDVFSLSIFCVRPDAQRTGVGSRLLWHLEEHLCDTGTKTVYSGPAREHPPSSSTRRTATG